MKQQSQSIKVNFMLKEELEILQKRLFEKIYKDVCNKYSPLLNDKEYDSERFYKDFKNEIEKNYDFNNPDYKKFFVKIEKIVLKKLSKVDDVKREVLPEKQQVEYYSQSQSKSQDNINNDKIKKAYNDYWMYPDKVKNNRLGSALKKKEEEDEWAIVNKYQYDKLKEEENLHKENLSSAKKTFLESLNKQMKEKEILEKIEKEKEEYLYNHQKALDKVKKEEEESYRKKVEKGILVNQIIKTELEKSNIIKENKNKEKVETEKKIENNYNRIIEKQIKEEQEKEAKKLQLLEDMKITLAKHKEKELIKFQVDQLKIAEKEMASKEKTDIALEKLNTIIRKKQIQINYRNQLESQIHSKKEEPFMNDIERSLNKKFIESVKNSIK